VETRASAVLDCPCRSAWRGDRLHGLRRCLARADTKSKSGCLSLVIFRTKGDIGNAARVVSIVEQDVEVGAFLDRSKKLVSI
jgi:hypothetical protein